MGGQHPGHARRLLEQRDAPVPWWCQHGRHAEHPRRRPHALTAVHAALRHYTAVLRELQVSHYAPISAEGHEAVRTQPPRLREGAMRYWEREREREREREGEKERRREAARRRTEASEEPRAVWVCVRDEFAVRALQCLPGPSFWLHSHKLPG